jgi:hypothetical protein
MFNCLMRRANPSVAMEPMRSFKMRLKVDAYRERGICPFAHFCRLSRLEYRLA